MPDKEKLRLDKYLWAIRLFKTRSLASDACANNKVKNKGVNVKAAKTVTIGDQYEVKTEAKRWRIKVTGLLYKRVKFEEAIKYAQQRVTFGKPICEHQAIQLKLADMATNIEASRLLIASAAEKTRHLQFRW